MGTIRRFAADIRHPQPGTRHATWMELFFDLVFVVILARLTHYLAEHPTLMDWLVVVLLFYPIYIIGWGGHTTYANRFSLEDGVGQATTVILMAVALVYGVGVEEGLKGNMNLVIGGYLAARLLLWFNWARVHGFQLLSATPKGKVVDLLGYADLALWAWSAFLAQPWQQYVWVGAIMLQVVQTTIVFGTGRFTETKADNAHVPERFGLFVIIALGESIVALGAGLGGTVWTLTAVGAAAAALLIITSVWWLYFGFLETHIIGKADLGQAVGHAYLHVVLIVGLMTLAAGLTLAVPGEGGQATVAMLGAGLLLIVGALHIMDHLETHRPLGWRDQVRVLAAALFLAAFIAMADRIPIQPALITLSVLFGAYVIHSRIALNLRHGEAHGSVPLAEP